MQYHIPIEMSEGGGSERDVPIHQRGATVLSAIFWTMLVLSTGVYVTWYLRTHRQSAVATVYKNDSLKTSDDYIAAIAKKILLPKDNTPPRVALVTDAALLAGEQEFYKGVEVGDVLVVFEESQRAILYSPRRDIIVNVGPVVPRGLSLDKVKPEDLEGDIHNQ